MNGPENVWWVYSRLIGGTMKCEFCRGSGIGFDGDVQTENGPRAVQAPCEACGGTGLQHCCEGLREQPDEWPDNPVEADTFGRQASEKRNEAEE